MVFGVRNRVSVCCKRTETDHQLTLRTRFENLIKSGFRNFSSSVAQLIAALSLVKQIKVISTRPNYVQDKRFGTSCVHTSNQVTRPSSETRYA